MRIVGIGAGTREVTATLSTNVMVEAGSGTQNNLVPVVVHYDAWWNGVVTTFGGAGGDLRNETCVDVRFLVWDLERDAIIHVDEVHRADVEKESYFKDYVVLGAAHDEGRRRDSFALMLRRGREYEITLRLQCHSRLDFIPTPPAYYCLDYKGPNRGGWTDLDIFVGQDADGALQEVHSRIDSLAARLEGHQHVYLTGRGRVTTTPRPRRAPPSSSPMRRGFRIVWRPPGTRSLSPRRRS